MSDDGTIDPLAVISLAKGHGLNGWGGHCASAALAINRLLFSGQGVYLVACNRALLSQGHIAGHVAVMFKGSFYDSDAIEKEFDDIESWGMLDEHDPDYANCFTASDPWDEKKAMEVVSFTIDEDEVNDSLLMSFDLDLYKENVQAIERALAEYKRKSLSQKSSEAAESEVSKPVPHSSQMRL